MEHETAFEMATSNIRYGPGVTREVGMDLADMGVTHVMVLADPQLAKLAPVSTVLESLDAQKIHHTLFDRVRIEPTDESFKEAIQFAGSQPFDAFVAVGGGSTMDTAKACNLYVEYPSKRHQDEAEMVSLRSLDDLAHPSGFAPCLAVIQILCRDILL